MGNAHNPGVFSSTSSQHPVLRLVGGAAVAGWLWSSTTAAQQPDGYGAPPSATFAPTDQGVPPPPPPPPYANVPGASPTPAYGTPQAPPPAYGAAPEPYPPPPGPAAAPDPYAQPVSPPPPAYGYPAPQPEPGYAQPAPGYAQPAPNYAQPSYAQPSYAAQPVDASYSGTDDGAFTFPDFSVRVDPLNWLLDGHLGFELEVEAFEWLTFETVPIFVTTNEPFSLPSNVREYSNGWGALAGASLNAGFWIGGNSFQGTVLRAGFTNYSYRYESMPKRGEGGFETGEVLDAVNSVQRRLTVMLGSGRRFGFLALAGGFGIEYDLLGHRRCIERQGTQYFETDRDCARDELMLLRRRSEPDAANLRGPFFPVELVFRFSIGVVFDDD